MPSAGCLRGGAGARAGEKCQLEIMYEPKEALISQLHDSMSLSKLWVSEEKKKKKKKLKVDALSLLCLESVPSSAPGKLSIALAGAGSPDFINGQPVVKNFQM